MYLNHQKTQHAFKEVNWKQEKGKDWLIVTWSTFNCKFVVFNWLGQQIEQKYEH